MAELGCKVARFLELTEGRAGEKCVHTLNKIFAAARRTNLPAWILEEAKKHRCTCGLLRNKERFVWDLMQRSECASETDHASLELLWMRLGSKRLGRRLTEREHKRRWLASQKARWERFDVPGLSRP